MFIAAVAGLFLFVQQGPPSPASEIRHDIFSTAPPLPGVGAPTGDQRFEMLYLYWRRTAGELSCRFRNIGPTGGFCRDITNPGQGGGSLLGAHIADELGRIFGKSSVIDMGCGLGQYGRYFNKHFPDVQWVGVDGAERVEEATQGWVKFADLSQGLPVSYRHPWDWVMSL